MVFVMNNDLLNFQNPEFGETTVLIRNGDPWFIGNQIADKLGYSRPRKAILDHVDEDDKGVLKQDTLGGKQNMIIINESGFYSLIFSSKLPIAKDFKKWVTKEVLPKIRKTGQYSSAKAQDVLETILQLPSTQTQIKRNKKLKNKGWTDNDISFRQLVARSNTMLRETLKKYNLNKYQYIQIQMKVNEYIFGMSSAEIKRLANVSKQEEVRNILPENSFLFNLLIVETKLTECFDKNDNLSYEDIKFVVENICKDVVSIGDLSVKQIA